MAAETFLENLLPDDENARRRMALRLHIDSIDTFLLLGNADTVGGLVFTAEPSLPRRPVEVRPVYDEEIAQQIGYVRANGYGWFARDVNDEFYERSIPRCRFSIAGGQPNPWDEENGSRTAPVRRNCVCLYKSDNVHYVRKGLRRARNGSADGTRAPEASSNWATDDSGRTLRSPPIPRAARENGDP